MKLEGYVRVSQVDGRSGPSFISPRVQREEIEKWARFRHADLLDVHVDLDWSGGTQDRPGLERAVRRVEQGLSEGIVVAKLDRFSRSLTGALETISRLDAVGGTFVSVAEGLDPSTPSGKLLMRFLLVIAEFELDRIRESFDDARRRAVGRGVHVSGHLPFGYLRSGHGPLVVDPGPAARVANCFLMRAERRSWPEILRYAEESSTGDSVDPLRRRSALFTLLKNRVYIGEAHSGPYVLPGAHEPIVDRGLFETVQATRGATALRARTPALLSGLLRCSGCGISLAGAVHERRHVPAWPRYGCLGRTTSGPCARPTAVAGVEAEALVQEEFLNYYASSALARSASAPSRARAEARLEFAERALVEYDRRRARGQDEATGREGFAGRVEEAREKLIELTRSTLVASPVRLRRRWSSLAPLERRRTMGLVIDAVLVRPGRGRGLADRLLIIPAGLGEGLPEPSIRSSRVPYEWSITPGSGRIAVLGPEHTPPDFR